MRIDPKTTVLIVFILVYLYLIFSKRYKGIVVWTGGIILLILGILNLPKIGQFINWNVLGIFAGTLLVAELFIFSEVPVLLANILINRATSVGSAILWVCVMSSLMSAFTENVATVLIVAPVALELSRKLRVSPVPFLVGIAISSNLQGTATLIGDPPSMILAAFEHMNFNDFFFYQGKPSIFFVIQCGAIASFIVLYLFFRKHRQPTVKISPVKVVTWIPTVMLLIMIGALAVSPIFDPGFRYLGGAICMTLGVVGLTCHYFIRSKENAINILKRYDWDTTLFLAGVFVLVGLLDDVGLIEDLKNFLAQITGGNRFVSFTLIVWASVLISAFIDNVPYITAMLPVVHRLGMQLDGSPYLLIFGLLIGSCLGGNITPIGAAANIVSVGILKKNGHTVSFWTFVKIGLPFTLAATLAGYIFLLLVWG